MQRPDHVLAQWLAGQRGGLAEWVPVFLAVGVGCYFALPFEPSLAQWTALSFLLLLSVWLGHWIGPDLRPVLTGVALAILGLGFADLRAWMVDEPILEGRYYGPVQGRIVGIDLSASEATRLTLDQVVLSRHEARETPRYVRVSLHGEQDFFAPVAGQVVAMTAHLSAPSGPVEPGGFDFQRQAYFQRLGAIGYTRTPALLMRHAQDVDPALWLERARLRASAAIREYLPGQTGAFAAAIMTGDRSGISAQVTEDLRNANLSHLLAISGLHMGLLTGFVFTLCRYLLIAVPRIALRHDIRKFAAVSALLSGAAYLALSGGNVATLRAFVMVSVMYVAVLIGRRAITLRSVAVAATIIMVLTPEALTGPGFQMSFAATTALVAVFGWLQDAGIWRSRRWVRAFLTIFLSSLVAGLATAPVAAAHFNRFANFGLIANLLSVPLMGVIVMPGAVIAAVLAPLGLGGLGLSLMAPAIDWVLSVAAEIAGWDNAARSIMAPPRFVLPLFALGALGAILVRGGLAARVPGIATVACALILWSKAERPDILVSERGSLVGYRTEQGRALSKPKGDGFVAERWLENDGDPASQLVASQRAFPPFGAGGKNDRALIAHVVGRDGAQRAIEACGRHTIVVTTAAVDEHAGPCLMIDKGFLAERGAVAIMTGEKSTIEVTTVRDPSIQRPWTRQ